MEISKEDSLITYPCDFPIRVVAVNSPEVIEQILVLVGGLDPTFDRSKMTTRPSKKNNYIGLGLPIYATSREQLDSIYLALTGYSQVKMVL